MNTSTVSNQAVLATLRKAGLTMGRNLTSSLGWVVEAVDNNNKRALTINGRVHTPAEAVRLSFNCRGYNHAAAKRDAQLPTVIEALTGKGLTVTQIGETQNWLVRKVAA